jgi:hypothetical protein
MPNQKPDQNNSGRQGQQNTDRDLQKDMPQSRPDQDRGKQQTQQTPKQPQQPQTDRTDPTDRDRMIDRDDT